MRPTTRCLFNQGPGVIGQPYGTDLLKSNPASLWTCDGQPSACTKSTHTHLQLSYHIEGGGNVFACPVFIINCLTRKGSQVKQQHKGLITILHLSLSSKLKHVSLLLFLISFCLTFHISSHNVDILKISNMNILSCNSFG